MRSSMPVVRKMSVEESRQFENRSKGVRKLIAEEYDLLLAPFNNGDYGEVLPAEGEHRLTVRNRLKASAKRRGLTLQFRRTEGPSLRFKVGTDSTDSVEVPRSAPETPKTNRGRKAKEELPPVSSFEPPTVKRRGRPKKENA